MLNEVLSGMLGMEVELIGITDLYKSEVESIKRLLETGRNYKQLRMLKCNSNFYFNVFIETVDTLLNGYELVLKEIEIKIIQNKNINLSEILFSVFKYEQKLHKYCNYLSEIKEFNLNVLNFYYKQNEQELLLNTLNVFKKLLSLLLFYGQVSKKTLDSNDLFLREKDNSMYAYALNGSLDFISKETHENILFIGNSIHTLTRNTSTKSYLQENELIQYINEFNALNIVNSHEFDSFIKKYKKCISNKMYLLFIHNNQLTNTLESLRNFMLLGNANYYQLFTLKLYDLCNKRATIPTLKELNGMLKRVDSFNDYEFDLEITQFNTISDLTLDYKLEYPLNLFYDSTKSDYIQIQKFLFHLYQTQYKLRLLYAVKRKQQFHSTLYSMLYFIDSLYSFLQMDVIQFYYDQLHQQFTLCADYEELLLAHQVYLQGITRNCFMQSTVLLKNINDICSVCLHYVDLIKNMSVDQQNSQTVQKSKELEIKFHKLVGFVFRVLTGVKGRKQRLDQLLLRLDFSGWYSLKVA